MEEAVFVILALARIAAGFLLCFFGYRLARFTFVAAAALEGSYYVGTLISVMLYGYVEDRSEYWVTFFVAGFILACVAGCHTISGIGIVGFATGMELVILIVGMVDSTISTKSQLLWMAITGLVFAIGTLTLKKRVLVTVTSFVGASLLTTGIRYFVWRFIADQSLSGDFEGLIDDLRSSWWTLTAISLAVFALGMAIQFAITARDFALEIHQDQDEAAPQYSNVQTPLASKPEQIQDSAIAHV